MQWKDRILIDPAVLVGKPVIKGTRIAIEFIVDLLAEGWTPEQIVSNHPQLTAEDIQAALRYASEVMKQERVYPLSVGMMAKFLANENVPGAAVHAAQQAGIDLTWVGDLSPGLDDESVLAMARRDGRVVVTFDEDFGELAFHKGSARAAA